MGITTLVSAHGFFFPAVFPLLWNDFLDCFELWPPFKLGVHVLLLFGSILVKVYFIPKHRWKQFFLFLLLGLLHPFRLKVTICLNRIPSFNSRIFHLFIDQLFHLLDFLLQFFHSLLFFLKSFGPFILSLLSFFLFFGQESGNRLSLSLFWEYLLACVLTKLTGRVILVRRNPGSQRHLHFTRFIHS